MLCLTGPLRKCQGGMNHGGIFLREMPVGRDERGGWEATDCDVSLTPSAGSGKECWAEVT